MIQWLNFLAWLACVAYATVPVFWLMIHPWAARWRGRKQSPYFVLLPLWFVVWIIFVAVTWRWREMPFYSSPWTWIPAGGLFAVGLWLYSQSAKGFSAKQLGGVPELNAGHREQRLVTDGIRSRVRHPVYLAHLCEMLAWSVGTGLLVCYVLTVFAALTGAIMIRMEDDELEQRFGIVYTEYRRRVPAILPRFTTG
jgi:protein-S-isoprenylcysteine O-methyltransferase Ste14